MSDEDNKVFINARRSGKTLRDHFLMRRRLGEKMDKDLYEKMEAACSVYLINNDFIPDFYRDFYVNGNQVEFKNAFCCEPLIKEKPKDLIRAEYLYYPDHSDVNTP
jgi:hypothetical protein